MEHIECPWSFSGVLPVAIAWSEKLIEGQSARLPGRTALSTQHSASIRIFVLLLNDALSYSLSLPFTLTVSARGRENGGGVDRSTKRGRGHPRRWPGFYDGTMDNKARRKDSPGEG